MKHVDIYQDNYQRTMGSFKPRFQGRPADYWELSGKDTCSAIIMLLLTIGVFLALGIGCMFWIVRNGSGDFALTWSIIIIIFGIPFFYFSYSCSRSKKSIQEKMIKQSIALQQTHLIKNKIVKDQHSRMDLMNQHHN